ncbi:unnamed protein product [Coregonus sp. 'balchen']|nr:unnamed protein product [Coregonus sp. 'balchen']
MPEQLTRPVKRSSTSPSTANTRPHKRHCTFSAISEVGQGERETKVLESTMRGWKIHYIKKCLILSLSQMSALLEGKFSCLVEYFSVVDCCYPYEYQGGHIKGALSMPNTDEAVDHLQSQRLKAHSPDKRLVLVLHCEFSSERVPRTCRLLRSVDRSMNKYPALHYPELYILKGGYRDFYHSHIDSGLLG